MCKKQIERCQHIVQGVKKVSANTRHQKYTRESQKNIRRYQTSGRWLKRCQQRVKRIQERITGVSKGSQVSGKGYRCQQRITGVSKLTSQAKASLFVSPPEMPFIRPGTPIRVLAHLVRLS